jgi:EmrB/QacA subfamily drug resistance transporter
MAMERKWWTLIAVCIAIFMLLLDITVVNVALPDIQRSLHASFSDLQWVVNAYALTLAAFLLTSGSLADLFGRRLVFTCGLVVFTLSSAACGLASSPLALNLARAVQGTGGAMMFATSLALIAQAFHGKERGIAFGVFGGVIGAAVAIGPVVGGVITSTAGWSWIFFVNVPIGVLAVILTLTQVGESRDPEATRVDWLGLVTFSGSLFLLVFALIQGNEKGWGSTEILSCLIGSAVLLILFVVAERAQERPMLDLKLFRVPTFTGASIVAFAVSSSMFAMFLYLTLYIQDVLGYGPLQAGLRFLPVTLLSFIVAPISGRLSVRVPVRLLLGIGLLLVGAGLLAMTAVDATSEWTVLIPGFVLAGAGIGLINPPLASTAIGVVHYTRSGMASGINNTFRQVGIATGIAGLGAVFQHELTHKTGAALATSAPGRHVLSSLQGKLGAALVSGEVRALAGSLPLPQRAALAQSYRVGFTSAFTTILMIAAAIALAGSVLAFLLVRARDFVGADTEPGEHAAVPAGDGAWDGQPAIVARGDVATASGDGQLPATTASGDGQLAAEVNANDPFTASDRARPPGLARSRDT